MLGAPGTASRLRCVVSSGEIRGRHPGRHHRAIETFTAHATDGGMRVRWKRDASEWAGQASKPLHTDASVCVVWFGENSTPEERQNVRNPHDSSSTWLNGRDDATLDATPGAMRVCRRLSSLLVLVGRPALAACHAGGRGLESRRSRKALQISMSCCLSRRWRPPASKLPAKALRGRSPASIV